MIKTLYVLFFLTFVGCKEGASKDKTYQVRSDIRLGTTFYSIYFNKNGSAYVVKGKESFYIEPLKIESAATSNICNTSKTCINTIKGFLEWYKTNFDRMTSLQNSVVSLDSNSTQYRVNFANAEKYLAALRSSRFFSDKFLQDKLQYFKDADKNLVKGKQNDGPPEGFDYDLLLYTQEPEAVLDKYNSLKTEVIKPNLVKLVSISNNLLFSIEEKQGNCVIKSINFVRK